MASQSQAHAKDHWTSQAYQSAAGFVPKLTTTVVAYLNAQAGDRILDIGCGDGQLTAELSQTVGPTGAILGLDASPALLSAARAQYQPANCHYIQHDATDLQTCTEAMTEPWDRIFSNAAMHWILRPKVTRKAFFDAVYAALKSGGTFAFEMGGHGNVGEIQAAALAALVRAGVPLAAAREASPWFFPSVDWMTATLQDAGFEVEKCEAEYRPTKLSPEREDGTSGIEGWVRLMCAPFLDAVEQGKREGVVREICELSKTAITREEDGSKWLGNVRLRAVAVKPSS